MPTLDAQCLVICFFATYSKLIDVFAYISVRKLLFDMKKLFTVVLFLLVHSLVYGQDKVEITGRVTNNDGEALIGVTIATTNGNGTSTDIEGNFTLLSDVGNQSLTLTYIGFAPIDTAINIQQSTPFLTFVMHETDNLLGTITVTSGRYERSLGEANVSLEVIKPQLVKSLNASTLDVLLEKVPGFTIIDGQANIRGGSGFSYGAGSRVLLLVDDVPALQSDAGFPNWSDMPIEIIDQVEVLKGAASSLYGSSAMNGIVNMRTQWPGSKPKTTIQVQGSQYLNPKNKALKWWDKPSDAYDINTYFTHQRKIGDFDMLLSGFYTDLKSFRQSWERRDYRITGKFRYRIDSRKAITLSTTYTEGDSESYFFWKDAGDNAYIPAPGVESISSRKRYFIDATYTAFTKKANRHKILTRFYDVHNENNDNRSIFSKLLFGEYQYLHHFNDWIITAGTAMNTTFVEAELYGGFPFTSFNTAAYLQIDKEIFKNFNLSFGGRWEYNQINTPDSLGTYNIEDAKISESRPVFKLAANYKVGEATFLRASIGQGYRYPTIAEMFIETYFSIIPISPNPALKSEHGATTEFGVKQGFALSGFKGFVDLAVFNMRYNNMMEFVFEPFPVGFQSQNIGDTKNFGFELSLGGSGKIGAVNINAIGGYIYIDPKYVNFTEEDAERSSVDFNVLKYRSKHNAKLDIQFEYKKLSLGISNNYLSQIVAIDKVFDEIIPGIKNFRADNEGGVLLTDFRIGYEVVKGWKLSFYVNNTFNQLYSLRPGLMDAPRNVTLKSLIEF